MRKYDNTIKSKFNTFIKQSLKQKIIYFLSLVGVKQFIYKVFYILFLFFPKNIPSFLRKIVFLRGVIFDIRKKKSKYIFLDEKGKEKFLLLSSDKVISRELFVRGDFDLKKLYKVMDILKNNYQIDCIYDIGANIGSICIPAVKRGIVQKAIAIEPELENYKLLKLNIGHNNLESKITTYNYALSFEDDKILDLGLSTINSGDHRIKLPNTKEGVRNESLRKTIKVKSKTFDSMFGSINSQKNLIWIDTQGFEANILLGAKKLISSGAPVVIEFWPYGLKLNNSLDKLKDILKNFDHYYDLSEEVVQKRKINSESITSLFSGWDEEKTNMHSLFTDLLLMSRQ